jgi:biopolymer transport protein ExbB
MSGTLQKAFAVESAGWQKMLPIHSGITVSVEPTRLLARTGGDGGRRKRSRAVSNVIAVLAKGGFVMIPLLVCSILVLAVVLERGWFWWRRRQTRDVEQVLGLAARGEWDEAARLGATSPAPDARVVAAGIRHRNPAPGPAMEAAALAERALMTRYLAILDTVITLSPLLGLLGTVTGMIRAFGIMAQEGMNQPHAITGGVAEALIATAAGLAIAIAALVPYNYFLRRAERSTEAMERAGSRLEVLLEAKPR